MREMEGFPTDHLPVMIRKTGFEWRNDYFDPLLPFSVDLHFRFWNPQLERVAAPGTEEFWGRRATLAIFGVQVPVLDPADSLAYACLHLLRHVLRGSVRPSQGYELARLLHDTRDDDAFWKRWSNLHPPELRRLQAVTFRLASEWFHCGLSPWANVEIERLPAAVNDWCDLFARSPMTRDFTPNKDEIWLHLNLVTRAGDRVAILTRRLFPARIPGPVDAVLVPRERLTWRRSLRRRLRHAGYVAQRVRYHARTLVATLRTGLRWWHYRAGHARP
jgi:hypothetical protein